MVLSIFQRFLDWLKALFFKEEMELSLVGLQYSGKTTFVNVIASGSYTEDTIPTVGFNMRKVQKGNVSIKIWDIGGQPRFRTMWERYCRGVNVIVYMVDAADHDKIEQTTRELHELLDKPSLQVTTGRDILFHAPFSQGMPVLVLGNKNDLPNALDVDSLTDKLNLDRIDDREVAVYTISCKNKNNLDVVLQWLTTKAKKN